MVHRALAALCLLVAATSRAAGAEVVFSAQGAWAPAPPPPGGSATVIVTVLVDQGWHVNSHTPLDEFLIPTDVRLDLPPGWRAEPPVFYATIVVLADGEERKIDARPSDAIALAVRSNAPMFVEDDIMNRLGTVSTHAEEVDDEQEFEKFDEFVHTLSPDDF